MLGCAPLGGLYHKNIPFEVVQQVLVRAVTHHKIRDLDTAPWYGHGKSEADIGRALVDRRSILLFEPEELRIYTKVGRVMKPRAECSGTAENDPRYAFGDTCYAITPDNKDVVPFHDYTAAGVAESVRQSVDRLKLYDNDEDRKSTAARNPKHRIVSLRLHDCDDADRFKEATEKGGIEELAKQCVVSGCAISPSCQVSLGMNVPESILKILKWANTPQIQLERGLPSSLFKTVMMAGCWNLMDQSGLAVLEYCQSYNIEVHNAGIFGAGLLWGNSPNYRYRSAKKEEVEKRDLWAEVARELGVSLPAIAFAFANLPSPVGKICFGAASVAELDACVAAADASTTVDLVKLVKLGEKKGLFADHPGVVAKCFEWIQLRKHQQTLDNEIMKLSKL